MTHPPAAMGPICNTVEQDISADTLFLRLGDFAVSRILIFADAGTEHSTTGVKLYCFTVVR